MTNDATKRAGAAVRSGASSKPSSTVREARLKAALKANMAKRKAQAKKRAAQDEG